MSEIAAKAEFNQIRYAQLWEDADVLTQALATPPGSTLVSICSAGDNALALLTLDPAKVVVVDLSSAQIECLKLRIGAFHNLDHPAFLELMGSRTSNRRSELLARALKGCAAETIRFWKARQSEVVAYGAGGCGKFERYFRLFKTYILPLVHSRSTVEAIFEPRDRADRIAFLEKRWSNWRWRLMVSLFFSRFVMGWMGRDKAFFDHVQGSVPAHVQRRVRHATIDCDPSVNPFIYWIMNAQHGEVLPMPWRAEHFETIHQRLDRLDIRQGSLETFVSTAEKADGFNLSDIFEYMGPEIFETVYRSIVNAANPGARLVYFNMMAPRRMPPGLVGRVTRLKEVEDAGKAMDKAFFYSDFVVEEVQP